MTSNDLRQICHGYSAAHNCLFHDPKYDWLYVTLDWVNLSEAEGDRSIMNIRMYIWYDPAGSDSKPSAAIAQCGGGFGVLFCSSPPVRWGLLDFMSVHLLSLPILLILVLLLRLLLVNCDPPLPVFPARPQPLSYAASVLCRTSTSTKNVRRYARKNARQNVRRYVRKI